MINPTDNIQNHNRIQKKNESLQEAEVKTAHEKPERQENIKYEYRDLSSENLETTRDIDSNRKTKQSLDESNKSQSIDVENSEFTRNTTSNASKNPSQINSKNPSLLKKIVSFDENISQLKNSLNENVNNTSNVDLALKINDANINSSNLYNNFNNSDLQTNISHYLFKMSTPINFNTEQNSLTTANLKEDDLNRFKVKYDLDLNSNNPILPINDNTNLRRDFTTSTVENYTNPNIQSIPSYLNKYNNSLEDSRINSNFNYNPNISQSSFLNFNTNPTVNKQNEVIITSFSATPYKIFPKTPATSEVLNTFVPQYFESTYINKGYKGSTSTSHQTPNTDNLHFSNNADKSNFCGIHHEVEDYILFEDVENYKKHDRICKNCLSMLKIRKGPGSKLDARLYNEIIIDNKDILKDIKSNKKFFDEFAESTSKFRDANVFLKENILPLADEIIYICDSFSDQINSSLKPKFHLEEFRKLEEFIDTIDFGTDGAQNLFVTGVEKNKTIYKYINLASFLIKLSSKTMKSFPFDQKYIKKGVICETLKSFIIKISRLRKFLVTKLSLFIKFLLGSYYDFIFSLEGLATDNEFRSAVQLDFINNEELLRIKLIYDQIIRKKENNLRYVEEENIRIKHELEILRSNFAHFSEQESCILKLKQDLAKSEQERNSQNVCLNNLSSENERLTKQNNQIFSKNEIIKADLHNLKTELESRFRGGYEQLKSEYEKKMIAIGLELNETRFKLANEEQRYNVDIRNLTTEREGLLNKIDGMQNHYEVDMKALKDQLDAFLCDYNNSQKNLNQNLMQITALNQEKQSAQISLESARSQIANCENTIQNQSNHVAAMLQEREDLRQQIALRLGEVDNLKAELNNQVNMRTGLEILLNESKKNVDELINTLNSVKTEFTNKLAIIPQLESQVRDLNNANGQMNSQVIDLFLI